MTKSDGKFTKVGIFLGLGVLLVIAAACTGQATPEQPGTGISPIPTSSLSWPAMTATAPKETLIPGKTATPFRPTEYRPTASASTQETKDWRPPHNTVPPPTWTPLPTPVPYPSVNPTVAAMDFTSVTVKLPFTQVYEAHAIGQRLFFIGRVKPSEDPIIIGNSIFMHDLQTGDTKLLTTSIHGEDGAMCCMDISGDWMVWLTYLSFGGKWRVRTMNLVTGEKMTIDREEDAGTSTARPPYIALSGNNLIWSSLRKLDDGSVKGYVMRYDLANKQMDVIVETTWPESVGYVDIDGDRVVWSKGSVDNGQKKANVFMYNLTTSKLTQVTDDGYSGQPQINGNYLVWRQGFRDMGPIIISNLQTGERFQLPEQGYFILLGDGLLLWHEATGDVSIYLYDIAHNVMEGIVRDSRGKYAFAYPQGRQVTLIVLPDGGGWYGWLHVTGQVEVRTYPTVYNRAP